MGADDSVEYGMIPCSCRVPDWEPYLFDSGFRWRHHERHAGRCESGGPDHSGNVAREPHVVDLANCLNMMGADVHGAGTDVIKIRGVKQLHGCSYSIIPDQIEAGSYMLAQLLPAAM